jgi:hypothetical protein
VRSRVSLEVLGWKSESTALSPWRHLQRRMRHPRPLLVPTKRATRVSRGVNESDRIIFSPYPLSYLFVRFGVEWIMIGCGFNYGLYRTTDSDQKWSKFGLETNKDYRINTRNKIYFHYCKQYKQKIFRLANRSKFHQYEDRIT